MAPLSANSLAKLAGGMADNLFTSVARAWELPVWGRDGTDSNAAAAAAGSLDAGRPDGTAPSRSLQLLHRGGKPFLVAPAMNTEMWDHPLTAPQLAVLTATLGVTLIPPVSRTLACGDSGVGAMASVSVIVQAVGAAIVALGWLPHR